MVQLVRKVIKGVPTWAEDAPTVCPNRHAGALVPTWGPCPADGCALMGRMWQCRAVEAGQPCGEMVLDPEHVHREPYVG